MHLPHITPFTKSPIYFFTVCTAGRRSVLAGPIAFRMLHAVWQRSAAINNWYVGRYVLMPDHVHFFAAPGTDANSRSLWVKMWKSVTARHLATELNLLPPIWQEDSFDHILRRAESYETKWKYVQENPVRAGLCTTAEAWPWQGEIHRLRFE